MDSFTRSLQQQNTGSYNVFDKITMGVVVDNDDPLGQGRVRVICSALGDLKDEDYNNLPWALVVSPFLGGTIGRDSDDGSTSGPMAHGFWCTPQIGAVAMIACIDQDANQRVCLGFLPPDFLMNTYPNGKYRVDEVISGPYAGDDYVLSPTFVNHQEAFGLPGTSNYEWFTRGYEQQAVILTDDNLDLSYGDAGDIPNYTVIMDNGQPYYVANGHKPNPSLPGTNAKTNTIFGWTSPRGHSILMSDANDNMRMKLRTVKGSQILMDDTNERIYIHTAQGNNWIEMDFDGNIDVYSKASINLRAAKNINLTADELVNIYGGMGVHITTKGEHRVHSDLDTSITTDQNLRIKTTQSSYQEVGGDYHNKVTGSIFESGVNFNVAASSAINLTSATTNAKSSGQTAIEGSTVGVKGSSSVNIDGGSVGIKGGSDITASAGVINLNTGAAPAAPTPGTATAPNASSALIAYWTNRVPDHEPWARRSFVAGNTNHTDYVFPNYNDPRVGTEDVANLIARERNPNWRR